MSTGLQTLAVDGRQPRKLAHVAAENSVDGQPRRHARVDGHDARSAGVGDDRDATALREWLGVETDRDVEHLVDGVGANDAGLVEQRLDGRVAGGERGRVAAGRARAGPRPSGLDRDDRLGAADAARETREAARVAERLEIQQDDVRARIALPVLQQVVARDVGLVADADELGQAHLPGGGERENRQAQRAALRGERDAALAREHRREGRIQADGRIGVQQPHAVGTDHPHPVAADLVHELILQRVPVDPDFRKTGGDDDQGLHAGGRAVVDDAEDRGRRHGQNRQIDAGGKVARGPQGRDAVDVRGVRIDRIDRTVKSGGDERAENPAADAGRVARRADERDGPGREQRPERRGGRQPAALFRGRDAPVRRRQRQLHLQRRVIEPRPDVESRIPEDVDHRPVLGHRRRLKALEAVGRREGRQLLQQQRRDASAVQVIVDGKRGLGDEVGDPEIRGRGDDPFVVAGAAAGDQREALRRIGGRTEPIDHRIGRLAGDEEPVPPGLGRELVKEAAHRPPIGRTGGTDDRDRSVPEDQAMRVEIVGRRQRREARLHDQARATATSASGMTNSRSG